MVTEPEKRGKKEKENREKNTGPGKGKRLIAGRGTGTGHKDRRCRVAKNGVANRTELPALRLTDANDGMIAV